jgi:polyferredoxin
VTGEAAKRKRARGSVVLYAVAFGLVLASAWAQFEGNIRPSLKLVWTSLALSGVAVVAAVASLLVPKGPWRRGPAREGS